MPSGAQSPTGPQGIGEVFDYVAAAAVNQATTIVKPAAVVASSFAFPLLLMVLVLFFLAIQPRMDGRDPKLRAAPRTTTETLVLFEEEGAL